MKLLQWLLHWLLGLLGKGGNPEEMIMASNLTGSMWIDLSLLDGELLHCKTDFIVDSGGLIEEFSANLTGLSIVLVNRLFREAKLLWDQDTSGILDDGRPFTATVATISSIQPLDGTSVRLAGRLTNIRIESPPAKAQPAEWVFKLSNVKLFYGEVKSVLPLPASAPANATPGWRLDSIEFDAQGRHWRLTDNNTGEWKNLKKSELRAPVISGTLRTLWQASDSEDELITAAQDIADLLSIALSRSVNWVSYTLVDANGTSLRGYQRAAYVAGFEKHGSGPVDNYEFGTLKGFLELAIPRVASEREWYHRTLGLLLQAQISDILDVKCAILYMLADRLSSRIVQKSGKAEIDADLKKRAKDKAFVSELHAVLKKLSPDSWTDKHTDAVLGEIKRWNKMPSFVKKIQRACTAMSLSAPDDELLTPRNDLLHAGELNTGDAEVVEHYLELDWVVLALTLRVFGYEGVFYHPKFGQDPIPLKDKLVSPRAINPPTP